jgi:hypothetical protein
MNIFLIEKINTENTIIPVTDEEFYKNIVAKLGFFPSLPNNVKFLINNISDSCLLYSLYQKVLNQAEIRNSIHIHFDKYKAQPSLYFDGVINDKISGFNYDYSLSLIENTENVINFAKKVAMVFGGFELSISYTDIDEQ